MGKTSISIPDELEWAFKAEANKRRISYTTAIRAAFAAFVERKDISGECISTPPTDSSVDGGSANTERIAFHRMLDEILDSGIPKYVTGIEANLEWGARSTNHKKDKALVEGPGDTEDEPPRSAEQAKRDAERATKHAADALRRARGVKSGDRKTPKRDAS
jgi:hypothetical protein